MSVEVFLHAAYWGFRAGLQCLREPEEVVSIQIKLDLWRAGSRGCKGDLKLTPSIPPLNSEFRTVPNRGATVYPAIEILVLIAKPLNDVFILVSIVSVILMAAQLCV